MFSVGSQTHNDCKKEQRADSQDLEMIENGSQCVSKVRICYNSKTIELSLTKPTSEAPCARINRAGVGL